MTDDLESFVSIGPADAATRYEQQLLGLFDKPAFIRRALGLEEVIRSEMTRVSRQRDEWLEPVRMRMRIWRFSSTATSIGPLSQKQIESLARQLDPLGTHCLAADRPEYAWRRLAESTLRFNDRWQRFILAMDFRDINRLIEGYNRHYLFEKECALRSSIIARRGFQPIEPYDGERLLKDFPFLPVLPREFSE